MNESSSLDAQWSHVFAVILAGGSGTRLWPKSRDNSPKQFLRLGGERTMMQRSYDRIAPIVPPERIIVVTNAKYAEAVAQQLPQIPAANIIAEPTQRDTALAMALGTLIAQKMDPEAVVINLASDHIVKDENAYREVMRAAVALVADRRHLLTVGITPTFANVNFGYIQAGEIISETAGLPVRVVKKFKEKPDQATAEQFLAEGNYFWNANMYVWSAAALLAAFAQHQPELMPILNQLAVAIQTPNFAAVLAAAYEQAPKVSIDIAISEKVDNLIILPGDFGWDDIGLWSTVYELGEKNATDSVVVRENNDNSPVLELDSDHNLINTNGRLIAAVGLHDMVIIDSKDVLLILPRDKAADVKKVVAELKERQLGEYL